MAMTPSIIASTENGALLPFAGGGGGMDRAQAAATVGAVACLLTAVAVAAPFFLVAGEQFDLVGAYYAQGAVSPLALGLLGLVGAIIFAAGREGRSDPDLVAGIMLAVGLFSVVAAAQWALAYDPAAFFGSEDPPTGLLGAHRWSVVAASGLVAVAAGWYARALDLL